MRALVTGGAGFIGSTLVDRLVADGHEVDVVDNFVSGSRANLAAAVSAAGPCLRVHEMDIRDAAVGDLISGARPEVVFHLAAQADVRVSVADPVYDAEVNVLGSLRVATGAIAAGARKIVFASSGGTIYGEPAPEYLPVREDHPQEPLSPYGVAKMVVSKYLAAFGELHGLAWTSLALANVFGPRQDPHGEAGVVAIFAGRLLAGEPCKVFGTGEQTRDFVYVDDVVDAFCRAAQLGDGQVLNIGTGVETSVNELYSVMAEAAGVDAQPIREPARVGELDRNALDPTRARSVLGWEPGTDLPSGAINVLEWFRKR